MKSLRHYIDERITQLFNDTGAFFAFSNSQFDEKKEEGIQYVSLGAGLLVPKQNAKKVVDGLDNITEEGIKLDIEENGKDAIIKRELFNFECFYTGDVSDCVDSMKRYGFSQDEVNEVFNRVRLEEELD
ncbi:hypothetical protein B6A42_27050 (plasmid) [Vibrio coralliilyticus]|nr:hypothetical protein B6A42_27050 [Vibrio coralliilyticus]